jgi:SRSO17 transposase
MDQMALVGVLTLGKTANCRLGVSVNAACEQASCPLNWRLFLPESWDDAVEVRSATSAYAEQVRPTTAPYTGKGRRPRPCYQDKPSSLAAWRSKTGSRPVWS